MIDYRTLTYERCDSNDQYYIFLNLISGKSVISPERAVQEYRDLWNQNCQLRREIETLKS